MNTNGFPVDRQPRRDRARRWLAARWLSVIALFASACAGADAQTNGIAGSSPSPSPSPASSPAPLIVISGWRLECAPTTGSLACEALDRVSVRTSGAIVGGISVHFLGDAKTPEIVVQVPLGIAVPAGVRVGTTSGIVQMLPVSTCNRDGCFARAKMGEPLLGAMRAAKEPLRMAYDSLVPNADARTVTISLGLAGFAAAYDKLH